MSQTSKGGFIFSLEFWVLDLPPTRGFRWNTNPTTRYCFQGSKWPPNVCEILISEIEKPDFRSLRLHSGAQEKILMSIFGEEQGLFHSVWSPEADSCSQQRKDRDTHNKFTTEEMPNADKTRRALGDHRHCSSSHQVPIFSGTNHCSSWQPQRGKHFSSPHRQTLESFSIFPDGLSSSKLSWSRFLWPAQLPHPTQAT